MSGSRVTTSAEETERAGAELAASLAPGDVVLLHGDLGTGKTTFVRGALRALGITGAVTSPTFTIARRYEDGRVPVSHLDLHRVGALDEDLEDELAPERIAFVEWAPDDLDGLHVRLRHLGGDRREVVVG
jgi:tRNA threonylcarbamoyladenosine biosynthesis protein TsaE